MDVDSVDLCFSRLDGDAGRPSCASHLLWLIDGGYLLMEGG